MRIMDTENVEVEVSISVGDDDIEVVAEVELAENGEHDILSVCDENGKDYLRDLRHHDYNRIVDKALDNADRNW